MTQARDRDVTDIYAHVIKAFVYAHATATGTWTWHTNRQKPARRRPVVDVGDIMMRVCAHVCPRDV